MKKKYLLCLWFYVTRRSLVVLSSASVLVMSALPMELSCWCCSPHPFKYVHLHGVVFPALVSDWAFRVEEVIAVLWGWINELSTLSDRKIIALSVFFANQSVPSFSHDFRFEHWELMVPEKRWLFLSYHGARGVLIFFLRFFVLSLLSERYLCLLSVFDAEDVIQPKRRLTLYQPKLLNSLILQLLFSYFGALLKNIF